MRTDEPRPRPPSSDSNPIQSGLLRIRRWLSDLGPRPRLMLGGAALALLLVAAYFAANPTVNEAQTAWLFDSQAISRDDARRVLAALATAKIPASLAPHGQIAVPATRKSDALAILFKQKLFPKTLREIQDEATNSSIFPVPIDRGEQRDQVRQREAQQIISDLEGIESADVLIRRSTTRTPGQRVAKIDALVLIQTSDDRPISHQTLQAIQLTLRNAEPNLPPNALKIMDRSGKIYLDAGNPEVGAAMMAHVLEEEMRSKIRHDLSWIEGVRVLVALEPAEPAAKPVVKEQPAAAIVMNEPAEVVEPVATPPAAAEPATTLVSPPPGKARILVQVPISHYLHSYQITHHREATLDELKPYGAKVDETIRTTIENGIPLSQIASLKIDRIDSPGAVPPPIATHESSTIRLPEWVIPAAAGASVALVILVMIGTRWMVGRRPVPQSAAVPRAHFEVTDEAAPTGRVRELVRRDPAAAAGVLGRWIGQGGPTS